MEDLIAKCGCNCSSCPTYKENLQTNENRIRCSSGWEKYLNIKLKPEKLRLCNGCPIPDEDRIVYYLNCRVRKCAIFNRVKNCAYCSAFPCHDVRAVHSIQESESRHTIEERIGYRMPDKDYLEIVEPYEGIKHLIEIRKTLKPEDILEMIPVSKTPKTIPFPEEISINPKNKSAYREIHQLLSLIEVADNVSYARSIELDKNRKQLLKLLWTFGLFGEFKKSTEYILLSSEEYSAQKNTSYYSKLQEYVAVLAKYGLSCQFVSINDNKWLTKTGALRNKGWHIKISFQKRTNQELLETLKNYTILLDRKYAKNAFRYFSKADMRIVC